MANKSVMAHDFSRVPSVEMQRSSFNRSHGLKTTFDSSWLIPIFVDEALPGDTFSLNMTGFARLATPIHPIMDNLFMETFFFAVPNRILWSNWIKFCGEQENPGDSIDFTIPIMTVPAGGYAEGSLSDYLGIPPGQDSFEHSALWHRAYNEIWTQWFRDENLQSRAVRSTGDGPDTDTNYPLRRRGKRHDYFTSCLPWPQKGDSLELPLGTSAPVKSLGGATAHTPTFENIAQTSSGITLESAASYNAEWTVVGALGTMRWDEPALYTDLTAATAATINQLRQSFQIQRLLERDARGGSRYTEIVRSHFGVVSPDARLQRPEYLGGGVSMLNISPVAQTSSTDATTPQGNLSAFGTATLNNHGFTKSFTEHCTLLGLVSVRADLTYQQGLNRMFSRSTRYDFYWPALANIGEQTVLNKEIYLQGAAADDNVFGYQERYAEYRYKPSQITGAFRSSAASSLDPWHLSQEFSSLPTLGDTFIQDNPPVDRVIAVPAEPHFLFDAHFSLRCARPMPMYGVPGLVDHF